MTPATEIERFRRNRGARSTLTRPTRSALTRLRQLQTQVTSNVRRVRLSPSSAERCLKEHADIVQRLHTRTSRQPLPNLQPDVNLSLIAQIIKACCVTSEIAYLVAEWVVTRLQSNHTQMTALRVSAVCSFTNNDFSWPILEWKESDDTETIAIFHIEDQDEPEDCSWLMHSGVDKSGEVETEKKWAGSAVSWSVADLDHLKTLFGAAQHTLGILEWPVQDAIKLYCQTNPSTCSDEEMIKRLNTIFDGVAPILKAVYPKQGKDS